MPASKKYAPTHREWPKLGRTKVEWPPVPDVPDYRVRSVAAWLADHRNVYRPMTVTTPLLAIVCALHEKNYPLPTRRALAEHLDCNIFSIDAAISTALGEGEITEEYRYTEGAVEHRSSIRRRRWLIPSQQLFDAYNSEIRTRTISAMPLKLVG